MLSTLLRDIPYALRSLRNSPAFTAVVCCVLALGIGANSALFTVVQKVLLEPLPFVESERLVEVHERSGGSGPIAVSWPNYVDWTRQQRSFEPLAFAAVLPRLLPMAEGSQQVAVAYVTADFFETYRVKPAMGRTFSAQEDSQGAAAVAVLDRGFWKDRFGGDAAIVGRTIRIDSQTATIIGVLPDFPWYREAKIYMPVSHALVSAVLNSRENHNSSSVTGRLKPGVTLEQGYADLAAIQARLAKAYPGSNRDLGIHAVSLQEWVTGGSRRTILALFGSVALLLLLACVNVANMMLARSVARTREFSVRLALGASRSALVRQLLTECLLLGVWGTLLGLVVSRLLLPALATLAPASIAPRLDAPNWTVFAFTAVAGVLSALIFGAAPAFAAARVDLHQSLKERSATAPGGHPRLRGTLVAAQVSLALVLLAGAGLLLRSLTTLLGEDPGFRTDQLIAMKVSLAGGDEDLARLAERFAALEERVRALPGVKQVAATTIAPMANSNSNAQIVPEGFEIRPGVPIPAADFRATSTDYFATMGVPILKGRVYNKADGRMPAVGVKDVMKWFGTAHYQVVVNEEMARKFWPGQDPIGRRFRFGPPSMKGALMTVCGVAANVRRSLDRAPQPTFYVSLWMYPWNDQSFLIRTAADPAALTPVLRRSLLAAESSAVISEPRTFDGIVRELTSSRRSNLYMMGAFAGLALILAAIGIYGVVAYTASQRRREFAVRIALGATSGRVLRSVLGDASKLILAGVAVGLAAAVWLSKLIAGLLYGVKPADPWSYAAAVALLLASGLAATLGPAWRAAAADPAESLRAD